jgi:hypothetical protein
MFNPMSASELILGLARVLRLAAEPAAAAAPDDYRRSQLLSAHSLARHLAAEQAAAPELLAWLRMRLVETLAGDPACAGARAAIAAAGGAEEIGAALTALLGDEQLEPGLRRELHALLAELADREVAALAGAEA